MPKQKFSKCFFVILIICFSLTVYAGAASELLALGNTTGIKLHAEGAIVVGLSEDLENNPCKNAGIANGDIIKSIDGEKIYSNDSLKKKVEASEGKSLNLVYLRDGEERNASITPVKNKDGRYCLGIWIRDSIAGIGTLTYYDPDTGKYGALGHGICDSGTNVLVPVEKGSLMESKVIGIKRGEAGEPGELMGEYNLTEDYANITKNSDCGIFGKISKSNCLKNAKKLPVASAKEIKKGKATILANLDGDTVEEYEIEIVNLYHDNSDVKNMLIRATDKRLLEKTGGIVRGMSGSPILQNGKIIGAVTHVLVNDPTKGYGIFIENMLEAAG